MHRPGLAAALLVLLAATSMAGGAQAQAEPQGAALQPARAYTSTVWDGAGHAYVFGGLDAEGALLDQIVRYTPAQDKAEVMGARLPLARLGAAVVWDGDGHAYVFGGRVALQPESWVGPVQAVDLRQTADILRYTPATDTLEVMPTTLPTPRYLMAAVWDGEGHAYLFGGYDGQHLDAVVQYTPATGAIETLPARLPGTRSHFAAAFDGAGSAYLVGGYYGSGNYVDEVVRFDTRSKEVADVWPVLPAARESLSAVWGDGRLYIIGGANRGDRFDDILAFDPATASLGTLPIALPDALSALSAVWGDGRAYVFGGVADDAFQSRILALQLAGLPQLPLDALGEGADGTAGAAGPEAGSDGAEAGGPRLAPGPAVPFASLALLGLALLRRRA